MDTYQQTNLSIFDREEIFVTRNTSPRWSMFGSFVSFEKCENRFECTLYRVGVQTTDLNSHHDLSVDKLDWISGDSVPRDMKRVSRRHIVSSTMPAARNNLAVQS